MYLQWQGVHPQAEDELKKLMDVERINEDFLKSPTNNSQLYTDLVLFKVNILVVTIHAFYSTGFRPLYSYSNIAIKKRATAKRLKADCLFNLKKETNSTSTFLRPHGFYFSKSRIEVFHFRRICIYLSKVGR